MVITVSFILLLLSFLCFIADAFGVASTRVGLQSLGLALLVASMLFAGR